MEVFCVYDYFWPPASLTLLWLHFTSQTKSYLLADVELKWNCSRKASDMTIFILLFYLGMNRCQKLCNIEDRNMSEDPLKGQVWPNIINIRTFAQAMKKSPVKRNTNPDESTFQGFQMCKKCESHNERQDPYITSENRRLVQSERLHVNRLPITMQIQYLWWRIKTKVAKK